MAWERNGINGQPARPERGTAGARHAGGEVQDPERVPHDGNARADDSWLSDSDRRAGAGLRHAPGSAGAGRQGRRDRADGPDEAPWYDAPRPAAYGRDDDPEPARGGSDGRGYGAPYGFGRTDADRRSGETVRAGARAADGTSGCAAADRDRARTGFEGSGDFASVARRRTPGGGRDAADALGAEGDRKAGNAADASGDRPLRIFTGDRVLWIIVAALAVISILVVYSSTAKMAYDAHAARTTSHFLKQQVMILTVSLGLMIAVHKINCRVYNHLAVPAYVLSVLLTAAVYFIGATTNGAARWIPIGPFQFQPSEALKVATVLFLARQLAGRQSKIDRIRIVPSWRFWTWRSSPAQRRIWREGTVPILLPVVLSCLVIFPAHTSSAVLVFAASWVMMLIGRVRIGELLKLVGWAAAGIVLIMALNLGRSETAEGRVSTWIHLWTRSQTEKPIEHLTDTERSMIAIHNGGILGKGAGQSDIRVEMIHPESDYAYAFFVEEYGIVLAAALLMLYLWIFFRAIEIFRRCGTAFPGLLVLGLALLITCQALLHIMVTVNLIPETGQTLPLISRGGSSVLFTTIALGMILSVSRQNDEQSHDTPKNESIYEK